MGEPVQPVLQRNEPTTCSGSWQIRNLGLASKPPGIGECRLRQARFREVQVMTPNRERSDASKDQGSPTACEPMQSLSGINRLVVLDRNFQPHLRRSGLPIEVLQAIQAIRRDATRTVTLPWIYIRHRFN